MRYAAVSKRIRESQDRRAATIRQLEARMELVLRPGRWIPGQARDVNDGEAVKDLPSGVPVYRLKLFMMRSRSCSSWVANCWSA